MEEQGKPKGRTLYSLTSSLAKPCCSRQKAAETFPIRSFSKAAPCVITDVVCTGRLARKPRGTIQNPGCRVNGTGLKPAMLLQHLPGLKGAGSLGFANSNVFFLPPHLPSEVPFASQWAQIPSRGRDKKAWKGSSRVVKFNPSREYISLKSFHTSAGDALGEEKPPW